MEVEKRFKTALIRTSDTTSTLSDGTMYFEEDQNFLTFEGDDYYVSLRCSDVEAFEEETIEGDILPTIIGYNKKGKKIFTIVLE